MIKWICMLTSVLFMCLVISACGTSGQEGGSSTVTSTPTQTNQTETPTTEPNPTPVEISGFPWSGSGMEGSDTFTINGKLALVWKCQSDGVEPFMIQVWKKTNNGSDSPVGQQVIDKGANCPNGQSGQVIDFNGDRFTGYLEVTAIGPWTIDAGTYSP